MTPADLLADFYESEAVRIVVALVSVLFTILYIQVQPQGLGYIISVASGERIPYEAGTLILLVVAAIYLAAGGLRAVYWTDVVQGVWMDVAIWVGALVLAFELFGGPFELWRRIAIERPDLLTLQGPKGFFTPGMWFAMMISLCGVLFMPQMMLRYYTAASDRTIRRLGATTPIYLMTLYIPSPAHYVRVGRLVVLALLVIGYVLAINTFEALVVLVSLSGSGALQLAPSVVNVCFPSKHLLTRVGVLAGLGTGLACLFWTLVIQPQPFGVHGAVWSLALNWMVATAVSRFTKPPSAETVWRIRGEMERFVYGTRRSRSDTL